MTAKKERSEFDELNFSSDNGNNFVTPVVKKTLTIIVIN